MGALAAFACGGAGGSKTRLILLLPQRGHFNSDFKRLSGQDNPRVHARFRRLNSSKTSHRRELFP